MASPDPPRTVIHESPDHGETVYGRYEGTTGRWLVSRSLNASSNLESIRESKLWGDIQRAAQTNKTLQTALEHAIMIYHLSKDKENGQK